MKKLRLILSMVCLLVFGLIVNQADAQQTKREVPPTFSVKEAQALPAQAYVKMPVNFSVSEMLQEDEFNANKGITRPRYARDIPADITMENSGTWTELPDGRKVWRVAINAPNAKAITLRYDEFYLPAGSKLFLYSADKAHLLKYYDNTSNPRGKQFVTPLVYGDVIVLEYLAPMQETGDNARVKIVGVGYGYNHINIEKKDGYYPEAAGQGLQCQVNVICSPEGDNWQEQSTSVCAMYIYSGTYYELCSATLINNTANDKKPYIISAFHCYEGNESYLDFFAYRFFFESKTCVGNNGYDDDDEYIVGAVKRASIPMDNGSDGYLVELKDSIPEQWIIDGRIIFAGWDRRDNPAIMAQSGVGISHPALDVKKIATWTSPAYIYGPIGWCDNPPLCTSVTYSAANAHWAATFVPTVNGFGQSEGGSSGSGLLNQNGLLIGTLSGGGSASCSQSSKTSYYGGLFYHWDKYGDSPATQMKTWLDPVGGGTAEMCNPYPYGIKADFKGNPTATYALETVSFTSYLRLVDSIEWEFEGGTPATSTELNPVITYNAPGVFDVTLNAYGKNIETDNDTVITVLKEDYINVTLKGGTPVAPVADFGLQEFPTLYSDNATTPPTTIGTTGTYVQQFISQTASTYNNWQRVNVNGPASSSPGLGYDGTGDYCYRWYRATYSGEARLYQRVPVSTVGQTSLTLEFQYKNVAWGSDIDGFRVEYSVNNGSTWSVLLDLPKHTAATATSSSNNTGPWRKYELPLPSNALNANLQIAFVAIADYGYGLSIDDIKILGSPTIANHVIIWEGDAVDYVDLSTGPAVLYKYEFEGGEPEESTTNTSPITVQYNVANTTNYTGSNPDDYYASQWVKNTEGEDDTVRAGYVTVIGRKLEADTNIIKGECGDAINETIILTANRDWTLTAPSWLTVMPTSGAVATPGVEQPFTITVSSASNTEYIGMSDYIVFTSDDGKASTRVRAELSTPAPNDPTALRYDSINAIITWDGLGCTFYEVDASPCDIINFSGDFETDPSGVWTTVTNGEGPGWELLEDDLSSSPRDGNFAHTGTHSIISFSYHYFDGVAYDVDNWLITPKVKVTDSYHTLTYWVAQFDMVYGSYFDGYDLKISTTTNDPSAFTTTLKTDEVPPLGPASDHYYVKYNVDLSAYVGQEIYIAFHHHDYYDKWGILLDDVTGLELSNCNLSSSKLGLSSGKINMLSLKNAKFSNKIIDKNKLNAPNKQYDALQSAKNKGNNALSIVDAINNGDFKKVDLDKINSELQAETAEILKTEQVQSQSVVVPQALIMQQMRKCDINSTNAIVFGNYLSPNSFYIGVRYTEQELLELFDPCSEGNPITLKSVTIAMYTRKDISLGIWKNGVRIHTQAVNASAINNGSSTYPPTVAPTTIILSAPVELSGPGDVYIAYAVTTTTAASGEFPYGVDELSKVDGGMVFSQDGGTTWANAPLGYNEPTMNVYIIGNVEVDDEILTPRPVGHYKLYRQRKVNGVPVGEPKSFIVTDTVYNDEDIQPGGEYCYWLTFVSKGAESCAGDTSCVFILYQQDIEPIDDIEMTYGDPQFFKIDKAGTDGYVLKSTVDDIDYFAGRTVPVKLEIVSGNSVLLTGVESNYTLELERAGVTQLRATQEGIMPPPAAADTLLPAEFEFTITVKKGDLHVIAGNNYEREEGQVNNPVIFTLDYQSFFYDDNVDTLDVTPTATCVADPLSPVGEYAIVVHVGLDQRYNVIPVNGKLTVKKSTVIPNVLTPNNDGYNDAFMPGNRMKIFNRYGVLIYETINKAEIDRGWNGRFQNNEKLVNPGVYYYVLYDENGKVTRKGSVNVVK
jgi:gliding motility-associated-like protein